MTLRYLVLVSLVALACGSNLAEGRTPSNSAEPPPGSSGATVAAAASTNHQAERREVSLPAVVAACEDKPDSAHCSFDVPSATVEGVCESGVCVPNAECEAEVALHLGARMFERARGWQDPDYPPYLGGCKFASLDLECEEEVYETLRQEMHYDLLLARAGLSQCALQAFQGWASDGPFEPRPEQKCKTASDCPLPKSPCLEPVCRIICHQRAKEPAENRCVADRGDDGICNAGRCVSQPDWPQHCVRVLTRLVGEEWSFTPRPPGKCIGPECAEHRRANTAFLDRAAQSLLVCLRGGQPNNRTRWMGVPKAHENPQPYPPAGAPP